MTKEMSDLSLAELEVTPWPVSVDVPTHIGIEGSGRVFEVLSLSEDRRTLIVLVDAGLTQSKEYS